MISRDLETSLVSDPVDVRIARIDGIGTGVLRYGTVLLLVGLGAIKFFPLHPEGIKPFVANSPFFSWMLGPFGLQGTSSIIGTIEIVTGLAIAARPFSPTASAVGSAAGVLTFLSTLTFLFSTPGALSPKHPLNAFLLKDVVLLGACLATLGEALGERARRARRVRRAGAALPDGPATRGA